MAPGYHNRLWRSLKPHILAVNRFSKIAGRGKQKQNKAFDQLGGGAKRKIINSTQRCVKFLLENGGSCPPSTRKSLLKQKTFFKEFTRCKQLGKKCNLFRNQRGSGFFDLIGKGLSWLATNILNT